MWSFLQVGARYLTHSQSVTTVHVQTRMPFYLQRHKINANPHISDKSIVIFTPNTITAMTQITNCISRNWKVWRYFPYFFNPKKFLTLILYSHYSIHFTPSLRMTIIVYRSQLKRVNVFTRPFFTACLPLLAASIFHAHRMMEQEAQIEYEVPMKSFPTITV